MARRYRTPLERRRKPIFAKRSRAMQMRDVSLAWAMPGLMLACAIGAGIAVVL